MKLYELLHTTSALSGLICLTMFLLTIKKQLKSGCRCD